MVGHGNSSTKGPSMRHETDGGGFKTISESRSTLHHSDAIVSAKEQFLVALTLTWPTPSQPCFSISAVQRLMKNDSVADLCPTRCSSRSQEQHSTSLGSRALDEQESFSCKLETYSIAGRSETKVLGYGTGDAGPMDGLGTLPLDRRTHAKQRNSDNGLTDV